jgi:hypothetical protein
MAGDVRAAVTKQAAASKFASSFVDGYLSPAFGAKSKSEIDLLVFGCLIEAGVIDPNTPIYDIARALNITPARTRSLILNWQLRAASHQADLRPAIANAVKRTHFSKDGTMLAFGIENPLLREDIIARLKRKGVFADTSFQKELVRMPVEAFVEFLDDILDEETKKQVKTTLVNDKQLPNTSFKALAKGVLAKLGEKVAGEAGEEIVGEIVEKASKPAAERAIKFVMGLLAGDARAATRNITKDDFLEE